MEVLNAVDTGFDVRTDAGGKDPDSHSKTLRRYHQLLWSRALPSGPMFDLDSRLHHKSDLGEFWLGSDGIIHLYQAWDRPPRLVEVIQQVAPAERAAFIDLGCTVGAFVIFPYAVRLDGKWPRSINQSRGMHPKIRDRFDLTLECIRRHYQGSDSPLSGTLERNTGFFALFGDFQGYVDYFLLHDLVDVEYRTVRFFKPFDDFAGDQLPAASVAEYRDYMRRSMDFVHARNERINRLAASWAASDRS